MAQTALKLAPVGFAAELEAAWRLRPISSVSEKMPIRTRPSCIQPKRSVPGCGESHRIAAVTDMFTISATRQQLLRFH
jgi:hypothetical protein